ncbi:MAG: 3-oxoacyl-ACP reductase FabG [Chloroflexi bacterium]|nr:3-oxoacyl-ACP reductase FabG [Chloroflexota bacterium]
MAQERMMRLANKVVLVTGGGLGIGRATALRCAAEGARVAILDRHELEAATVVAAIESSGGQALPVVADVARPEQVSAAVTATLRAYGRLDGLVANAAIQLHEQDAPAHLLDEQVWDRTHDVNLRGVFLCLKAVLRQMLAQGGGGSIITIASVTGLVGAAPDYTAYTASKGGVIAMTRGLAVQYAPDGIRLNTVCPGPIETPLIETMLADAQTRRWLEAKVPLGRLGRPEEIAAMAVWLLSDEASFATGGVFAIDGGLTAV